MLDTDSGRSFPQHSLGQGFSSAFVPGRSLAEFSARQEEAIAREDAAVAYGKLRRAMIDRAFWLGTSFEDFYRE